MTTAAKIAELPPKPVEPEFRDDRWYYRGFSQYPKDEAYRVYNRDLAHYYLASLSLALEVLEVNTCPQDECEWHGCKDARLVLEAMKEYK